MKRADFRFREPLRVRWAEVDLQKVVFNGHYLLYVDTAMAGYWRALAMPYAETMAALQGDLFVRKATLEYEAPARYDEQLEVGLRCTHIGTTSIRFAAGVFRGERRLVQGELVYVFADPAAHTPQPVPAALRAWFEAFEAGEAMTTVLTGGWEALGAEARALRRAVFQEEQGIAAELMVDAADPGCVHAVARNRTGLAVASGRLLPASGGVGQIGRMATHAGLRGAGIGRGVLEALMQAARERGDSAVRLNAQASAIGFYRRQGFIAEGPAFEEAGIPHQAMRLAL